MLFHYRTETDEHLKELTSRKNILFFPCGLEKLKYTTEKDGGIFKRKL